jgi:DNA-binding MarR family transcriptional regulator
MKRLEANELRAWKALINAHATAVESIEARLAEAGLPPLGWYDVLWTLYRSEDRRLRPHELAREVVVSRSWLSRLSDRLVKEGLIEREQCPSDRRGMFLVLTDAGEATLRRMWPVLEPAIRDHFVRHLSCPTTLAEILEPIARAEVVAEPAAAAKA